MAEKKEEAIIITITGPDGDERDYAQDVVIPFQGKEFAVLVSIPTSEDDEEEPDIILARIDTEWKMGKQNTFLRRMMNMMQSQISMMRCEKHYKRAADVSAALFIKMC